jgi:hypothetical protein
MINWLNLGTTANEMRTIHKIAKRAVMEQDKELTDLDILSTSMDIELAHNDQPLKLNDLLNAPESEFWHDILGIIGNLNRKTGKMENCFTPRYAQKQ